MQPFQCDLQPELQETHRTTHTWTNILAKHIGGTIRAQNDPSRNRRTHQVPFIVACSHFTRKNTRFRAPASSPQHCPWSMYCYMIYHPSSRSISLLLILLWCIDTLCFVTWSTTLHQGQFHCFLFFCDVLIHYVLLHDLPPFIKVNFIAAYSFVMYWYMRYCYMTHHPSSRSISLLLILLWCIDTLCIVTWPTTLHQGQFHCCLFFCDALIHEVLLHDPPPFIIVKVIRNSEVLTFPTSFDYIISLLLYIIVTTSIIIIVIIIIYYYLLSIIYHYYVLSSLWLLALTCWWLLANMMSNDVISDLKCRLQNYCKHVHMG